MVQGEVTSRLVSTTGPISSAIVRRLGVLTIADLPNQFSTQPIDQWPESDVVRIQLFPFGLVFVFIAIFQTFLRDVLSLHTPDRSTVVFAWRYL
jgi:hypothetical protein